MTNDQWTFELGTLVGSATAEGVYLEQQALTDHGLIVGARGAGKTTLGSILIDEVFRLGKPVLAIDATGDLSEQLETQITSSTHELEFVERVQQDRLDMSWARRMFARPRQGDSSRLLVHTIQALMGVLGFRQRRAAPEFALLENLITHEWAAGRDVTIGRLQQLITDPPMQRIGIFDIDSIISPRRRTDLALAIGGLFGLEEATSSFELLPVLDTERPTVQVVTFSDKTPWVRQFLVALLFARLEADIAAGESHPRSLQALIYMDEGSEFVPTEQQTVATQLIHHALDTWGAAGVGLVLVTRAAGAVDSYTREHCETWFVGKLPVPKNRQEAVNELDLATPPVDEVWLDGALQGLEPGQFVVRSIRLPELKLFQTR